MFQAQGFQNKRRTLRVPLYLIKSAISMESELFFELNSDNEIQLQIQGNQRWQELKIVQTQVKIFNQKCNLQKMRKKNLEKLSPNEKQKEPIVEQLSDLQSNVSRSQNKIQKQGNFTDQKNRQDLTVEFIKLENHLKNPDNHLKDLSDNIKTNQPAKENIFHNFESDSDDKKSIKIKRIKFSQFYSEDNCISKQKQDLNEAKDGENCQIQKKPKKHLINYELCTRQQQRRFIAFILFQKEFLSDKSSKLKLNLLANYVSKAQTWTLIRRYRWYLKIYPGITPIQIAQKARVEGEFSHEQIQAQIQKILETRTSYENFFVTQTELESNFINRINSFALHEFYPESMQFLPLQHYSQMSCKKISYRLLPCLKSKSDFTVWKLYQMYFQIQLEIPSVNITPSFGESELESEENQEKELKGFWISINGNQKNYYTKEQVIDAIRIADIENKLQQIQIVQHMLGIKAKNQIYKQRARQRAKERVKQKKQIESKKGKVQRKKLKKLQKTKNLLSQNQEFLESEEEGSHSQRDSKPKNIKKSAKKSAQKPTELPINQNEESEESKPQHTKSINNNFDEDLVSSLDLNQNEQVSNVEKVKNKKDPKFWNHNQSLRLFEFIILYEPLVSRFSSMRNQVRPYFKIAQKYVKSKDYDQCYMRYCHQVGRYSNFDNFLEKELMLQGLKKEEILDVARSRVHSLIKSCPMTINDQIMQPKQFQIKTSWKDKSDDEILDLAQQHIQKLKFNLVIKDNNDDDEIPNKISQAQADQKPKPRMKPRSQTDNEIHLKMSDVQIRAIFQYLENHHSQGRQNFQEEENKFTQPINFNFIMKIKSKN